MSGALQAELMTEVMTRLQRQLADMEGVSPAAVILSTEFHRVRRFTDLAKVRVVCDGATRPSLYVKITRLKRDDSSDRPLMAARVERDFAITVRLFEALNNRNGMAVVKPVACYPDALTIVTEEAAGVTPIIRLHKDAPWWPGKRKMSALVSDFYRLGQWAQALQAAVPAEGTVVSADEIVEYIDVRLRRLAGAEQCAFTDFDRLRVLSQLRRQLDLTPASALRRVTVHGDFSISNAVMTPERVTVMDLAMIGSGTVYHDVACAYHQLALLTCKPWYRPSVIKRLQRALMDGFGTPDAGAEPLFQIMLAQHVACHFVGRIERPAKTAGGRAYENIVRRAHLSRLRAYGETGTVLA